MTKLDASSDQIFVGFSGWGFMPTPDDNDYVNWYRDDGNKSSVAGEFRCDPGPEPRFVFAVYHQPPYSGYAHVIFYRDELWWYQSGSHCSCMGLEESDWKPEAFDPWLFEMTEEAGSGYRTLNIEDGEGENPEVTNAFLVKWLKMAQRAISGARSPSIGASEANARDLQS